MRYTPRMIFFSASLVLQSWILNFANADGELTLEWADQVSSGIRIADLSQGVSLDNSGNVFISGSTSGQLGDERFGSSDAFVSRFDVNGKNHWTQQLGSSKSDQSWDLAADGLGNVFIAGVTTGSFGSESAGGVDTFVSKYNAEGALLWSRQIGGRPNDDG